MPRWLTIFPALLPPALLLAFAARWGTLPGGAEGGSAVLAHVSLLLLAAFAGTAWRDSLRLGRWGSWVYVAVLVAPFLSWLVSPVPRAGRVGLVLLPAFLLLPAAVARLWDGEARRRVGVLALQGVLIAVASLALYGWWRLDTPGASLPLGHHNLLAAWLVALLPFTALGWRALGLSWPGRALALLAALLGAVALLGTRSLAAAIALAVVVAVGAWRHRWGRIGIGLAVVLVAIFQGPRLMEVVRGEDSSAQARAGYLQAGLRGWGERPALGWGPGASSWTAAQHLHPQPGVQPAGQVVADFHSLPVTLAYELGGAGLAVLVAAIFLGIFLGQRTGRRQRAAARDPALGRAAALGLLGMGIASFGGMPLTISALPVAAVVLLGVRLAAGPPPTAFSRRWLAGVPVLYAVAAGVFLLPLDRAHLAYDRAHQAATPEDARGELVEAVRLDPAFPLYRARLAWLRAAAGELDEAAAEMARQAAADAWGLTPLWLAAGRLGELSGAPWSEMAWARACDLDPLGAIPPLRLALGATDDEAFMWAARAFLAEPRLLASVEILQRPTLVAAAAEEIELFEEVGEGWRAAFLEAAVPGARGGAVRELGMAMDGEAATSVSLYAFRRQPWPIYLDRVALDSAALAAIDLVPATELTDTVPSLFTAPNCGLDPR